MDSQRPKPGPPLVHRVPMAMAVALEVYAEIERHRAAREHDDGGEREIWREIWPTKDEPPRHRPARSSPSSRRRKSP